MQASGIGGQGLKPLPSQSYHQIAVGAYVGLSSPLTLSLSQPRSPHLALLLARFVRIHDLNSIAFYLPSWGPGVVDDGIAEIRGSGVFPPLLSLSLYIYICISLIFPSLRPSDSYLCISREDAIEILFSEKRRILFGVSRVFKIL